MQLEKGCTKCGEVLPLLLFEKKSTAKYGRGSWCKACKSKDRARYKRSSTYKQSNLTYYYRNKDKWRVTKAKRRAAELHAVPAWLTELDFLCIAEFYQQAKDLTDASSVRHEVDHIIPLQGESVCGLHVPANLQVLTRYANRAKGNRI